jgi:hypothetical protein
MSVSISEKNVTILFCRRVGQDSILRPISNRPLAGETACPTSCTNCVPQERGLFNKLLVLLGHKHTMR